MEFSALQGREESIQQWHQVCGAYPGCNGGVGRGLVMAVASSTSASIEQPSMLLS